jgi:hypothetical protein
MNERETGTIAASSQDAAVVVQHTHDALEAAADAGDITATEAVLGDLEPVLNELKNGQR